MPLEHSDLDPLRDSIADAAKAAARANENATAALDISRSTADQVLDLRQSQQRTEASLNTHRVKSEERHTELLQAISGAASTDAKQAEAILAIKTEGAAQAEKLRTIETKLSTGDIGKIAGGVTALLVALAGALTLIATQIAPVLPSVVQAKYGQPAVVVTVQPAPSAAPKGSP